MIKLLFIFFVMGPGLFCYSLAYFLRHPQEWSGPLIIGILSFLLTVFSQSFASKKYKSSMDEHMKFLILITRIGGLAGGLIIGIMIYFIC